MTASTEHQIIVWDDKEGVGIRVREFPDNPDYICLEPSDTKSKEWFGAFQPTMDADFAEHLGKALIAFAEMHRKDKS